MCSKERKIIDLPFLLLPFLLLLSLLAYFVGACYFIKEMIK
jgi:hypothetical protein